MSRLTFRDAIKWLGVLFIAHIVAMVFFSLIMSSAVATMSVDYPSRANRTVLTFNIIFDIVFTFLYFKIKTSYISYQKIFKDIVRAEEYSFSKYFREEIFREQLVMSCVFALFQIPFVIFYVIFGMSLVYPILLEQFYIMDAGAYLVSGSALIGVLLNTLIFTVVFLLIRLLFFVTMKKNLEN